MAGSSPRTPALANDTFSAVESDPADVVCERIGLDRLFQTFQREKNAVTQRLFSKAQSAVAMAIDIDRGLDKQYISLCDAIAEEENKFRAQCQAYEDWLEVMAIQFAALDPRLTQQFTPHATAPANDDSSRSQ